MALYRQELSAACGETAINWGMMMFGELVGWLSRVKLGASVLAMRRGRSNASRLAPRCRHAIVALLQYVYAQAAQVVETGMSGTLGQYKAFESLRNGFHAIHCG